MKEIHDYTYNVSIGYKNAKDWEKGKMTAIIDRKEMILGNKSKHKKKYKKK